MKLSKKSGKTRRQIATTAGQPKILKILATTDFSDESLAGVRYAVALAEKVGAAVALLHVVDPPSRMAGMPAVTLAREDSDAALARARLETLAKRESKGDLSLTPCAPATLSRNQTAARERAADLIVIATHGYTGAKRVLLGSTAERVVRHARVRCSPSPLARPQAEPQNASIRPQENPRPD